MHFLMSLNVVQLLSCLWLFVTPWTSAAQASLSSTVSWSLLKLMSIESMMPSNDLILCPLLLFLPSIFTRIRVFSSELTLHTKWPKYWSSVSPSVLSVNIQGWFPLVPQLKIKPTSPALQGRFLTTGPPRKSLNAIF